MDEEVRPTRYGKIMRATRPPIDPARLRRQLDALARHVAAGRPDPVARALWDALRAGGGRSATATAKARGTSHDTTHGERQ